MPVISIAATTIQDWDTSYGSDVVLRIYPLASFLTSDTPPVMIQGGPLNVQDAESCQNWYSAAYPTLAGTVLTIPATALYSTTDSPDNPSATYAAALFSRWEGIFIDWFFEFSSFFVPASPTSTTWAAIALAQKGTQ